MIIRTTIPLESTSSMKTINTFLFLIIGIIISCRGTSDDNHFESRWYEVEEKEWVAHLSNFGFDGTELRNHVLLIINTSECAPCMDDLAWWNQYDKDIYEFKVSLLVLERYEQTYNAFLKANQIIIPAYLDNTSLTLSNELVPTTPIKLYFNDEGKITVMDYMGSGVNLAAFKKKINEK